MKTIESSDFIVQIVIDEIKRQKRDHFVILVGGCSRTGKTTFSKQLAKKINEQGQNTLIVSIDSWLISLEQRKKNSKVYERYDTKGIVNALSNLLNNKIVIPPFYDLASRGRLNNKEGQSLQLKSGVIIFEGTISLSIRMLLEKSDLNIFVQTSEYKRIKRLIEFYSKIKGLGKSEYKKILLSREDEEIPFIKQSAKNAHIIFQETIKK